MSFTVPTFNLTCNIFTPGFLPPNPPRVVANCNLAYGRRFELAGLSPPVAAVMSLLLPALTDIRTNYQAGAGRDFVEVPAGSGRWYLVANVDDIGKGFANEHRCAVIVATAIVVPWPVPMP